LVNAVSNFRTENHVLGQENDKLHEKIAVLEEDRERKEVAVSAMTSAVKGLEGWIESTGSPARTPPQSRHRFSTPRKQLQKGPSPQRHSDSDRLHSPVRNTTSQRRTVIRGRGRFRGRYYINDHDYDHSVDQNTHDEYPFADSETQELQDGVKAWIRGFRDVEECVAGSPLPYRNLHKQEEDEWGDFQSPGVQHVA
jgi:hypothetical protein